MALCIGRSAGIRALFQSVREKFPSGSSLPTSHRQRYVNAPPRHHFFRSFIGCLHRMSVECPSHAPTRQRGDSKMVPEQLASVCLRIISTAGSRTSPACWTSNTFHDSRGTRGTRHKSLILLYCRVFGTKLCFLSLLTFFFLMNEVFLLHHEKATSGDTLVPYEPTNLRLDVVETCKKTCGCSWQIVSWTQSSAIAMWF